MHAGEIAKRSLEVDLEVFHVETFKKTIILNPRMQLLYYHIGLEFEDSI